MTDDLEMGDTVRHMLNPDAWGVVIGFEGSLVILRMCPSLEVDTFHEFELRKLDLSDDEFNEPDDPERKQVDNVVDFTKARALRANTKTKGVA